ncbi:hypothetical protein [Curtobacterium sp. RRHDQ10]|uniref:hypothetical protein n=1 Tax=Curtobacterium phyllosphaerae TaxID=3413379 RepID=UPI003BF1C90D
MKKLLAMIAAASAVASVLVGMSLAQPSGPDAAHALSGSSFDAGNIISDAAFYDGGSMSTDAVQSFLVAQGGTCRSSSCLGNGRFSMNARGADAMCAPVAGGASLSTAQIITQVATACGISPKVVLVTLQKEQGLVTATNPSAATLQKAMGYACPDTGNGCDPAYAGVGNQIYWSAWQWKRYGNPAGTSNYFTWFNPGTRQVQYNVPTSCGTKTVTVANKATAALYYYTPYTPNAAALANLYGTGDSCSAYGNRNFWRMYSDWFGDPTGAANPIGSLDDVTAGFDGVAVRGWAMDATRNDSTFVDVYVDGRGTRLTADGTRTDVGNAYPGRGSAHGFAATVAASAGAHTVCVYAIGVDTSRNTQLGCRAVTVRAGSPAGSLDQVQAAPGGVRVRGWALDAETTDPINVRAVVDGTPSTVVADTARTDVAAAFPGSGAQHGFDLVLPAQPGNHTVCLTAVNVGQYGTDTPLGACRTVGVPTRDAFGSVDTMTASGTTFTVSGWAVDGSATGPTFADVYIDGRGHRLTADRSRTDVGRAYPGWGAAHGFSGSWTLAKGPHSVCVYAISATAANTTLRCDTVTVTNDPPFGSLDAMTGVAGGIAVRGWVIDPDTTGPTFADVYVDGRGDRLTADQTRTDVGRAHPASGPDHGFSGTVRASAGTHSVCVYAIDTTGGDNPVLACRAVTVP